MQGRKNIEDKIKVIYISGSGRSGSTLLSLFLGKVLNGFPAGELRQIWHRGLLKNERCACGKRFRKCDFWNEVIKEALGSFKEQDILWICQLQRRIDYTCI